MPKRDEQLVERINRKLKMIFILIVYAAPGACREAADFLARPFASAGGGYSKRHIYLSFTIVYYWRAILYFGMARLENGAVAHRRYLE